jgi:haloalkane dehalogenase
MGSSSKPTISYRFVDHYRYLSAFLDTVVPTSKVILVGQDWGSALAFHWAANHQERVAGLAFMEFIRPFPTWDDVGREEMQGTFKGFRTPEIGRKMIIEDNIFVKQILPGGVARELTSAEKEYYEKPFLEEASREPVWRWPNELPIEGSPTDVWDIAGKYHKWLLETEIPKLMFWAEPGAFVREESAQWYLKNLKNVKGVFLGSGVHYLQEDHPGRIGKEVAGFIDELDLRVGASSL